MRNRFDDGDTTRDFLDGLEDGIGGTGVFEDRHSRFDKLFSPQ